MKKSLVSRFSVAAIMLLVMSLFVSSASIARGGGGGFSSGGGGRSYSSSSYSRPSATTSTSSYSRPTATNSTNSYSRPTTTSSYSRPTATVPERTVSFGTSGKAVPVSKLSPADKALYSKASKNHTVYSSRKDAQSAFTSKYSKSWNNKFTSEPKTRPDYIPKSYTANGRSQDIYYNRDRGSYGYGTGGAFNSYNPLMDLVMIDMLMHNHGYVVQTTPAPAHVTQDVPEQNSTSYWWILWVIIAIVVLWFIFRPNGYNYND